MGFLDNFVERKPKPETKPTEPAIKPVMQEKILFSNDNVTIGSMSPAYTGKMDAAFDKILEKENLPGPDVYELISSVKQLVQSGLPEASAYKAAFTSFGTMGLTKEKLIAGCAHYVGVIEKAKSEFTGGVIQKIISETEKLREQRKLLEEQLAKLRTEWDEISTKIVENEKSSETSSIELEGSSNKMLGFFKDVEAKINNYI